MVSYIHVIASIYTIMIATGLLLTIVLVYTRNGQYGFKWTDTVILSVCCAMGMTIGGKVLFIIPKIPIVLFDFSVKNMISIVNHSGFVFFDGLLGALLAVFLVCKKRDIPRKEVFNFFTPIFLLIHVFGQFGFFFGEYCNGTPIEWEVSMRCDPTMFQLPMQLIESGVDVLILIAILLYEKGMKKRNLEYSLLDKYLIAYSSCRFVLEFFRGDAIGGTLELLSTSQHIGLVVIEICVVWNILRRKRDK